ncbi:MAG: pilus assembly protein [Clostridiales bacterium GWB2_37_7]|nr:MAG: pilus assembly protein [Clostridiales bacterium GWB2_37_7]
MADANNSLMVDEIKKMVRESLDFNQEMKDEDVFGIITELVFDYSSRSYLKPMEKKEIIEVIFNSLRRLDILQPLLDNGDISEIMINGPGDIFIEIEGRVSKIDASFESRNKLEDVIQSIVSKVNRTVNEASPIVDARLADGSRVSVVLPPIALNGPILTIRKFGNKSLTMQKLIDWGTITREAAEFMDVLIKAKYNVFICGGTGSGKTTMLNVLAQAIPAWERIITIEDSAELQIDNIENIVKLETRNANTEGKGEITIRDLIRASLRMRPERIIVGEVRGAEALDMLQAMNTGHDGSISTGHANSNLDMLSRLETMVLSGAVLPLEAIQKQIASAIDIMIHVSRVRDKSRKIMEISEITGYEKGRICLNPLYVFEEEQSGCTEIVVGSLCTTGNRLQNIQKLKMAGYKQEI